MTKWSRRNVLQGAVGALVLGLAGAGIARAQTGGPTITVYKDPT